MKGLFGIFLVVVFLGCRPNYNKNKGKLEGEVITINIKDAFFACECARWYEKDNSTYWNDLGIIEEKCFYIEPAFDSVEFNDTIGFFNDVIQVTGQFYSKLGYPKGYNSYQNPEPARVFRYTNYKVIESHYQSHLDLINE